MRMKGVITVYLTMIFLLVMALIFTSTESVRVQSARLLVETAVDSSMESFLAGYQRELQDTYDLFFFDGAFGDPDFSREKIAGKLEEYMDYTLHPDKDMWLSNADFAQTAIQGIEIDKLALATDDKGFVFREQVVDYMHFAVGMDLIESLTKDYEWAMDNMHAGSEYESKQQETDAALASLEEEKAKADEEKAEEAVVAQEQRNPTVEVNAVRSMGILELMYADTSKVSQKSIDLSVLPSKRSINRGEGLEQYEEGVVSNILFESYLMKKFAHAASKNKKTDGNLQYQLEYLLIGKGHDVDNLKGVINRLLLIREGANFVYLLTDAAKVSEAYAAAALLVGYTGLPPLIEATKYAILLAWAYAESVIDVKVLLAGEKVALVKDVTNWKTSLANIGELASMKAEQMGDDNGVSYESYLRMLLLIADQKELAMRALDLIEIELQYITHNSNLKMDHMVSMLQASVSTASKSVFLSLPIMRGYNRFSDKNMAITRRYGYDQW